ncbi:ATP-dependent zinc metalloprotease FtsH [Caminicella sporogenes]|uniref:ATP-dependent zinc metalloprotease FtsH n=1 Tax=Caminicella sporogenes TaxID=166485 RepID=UPI002541AEBF|nr:ATP-dependent zinc metalloprotease FtsH [Caminicella sporogenes]WIF95660.1 ATP-dependent zinc metalloprotease FtsH [Caminicella sporogenes]
MRKFFRGASFYILIFIIFVMIVHFYGRQPQETLVLDISEFVNQLQNKNVSEIHFIDNSVEGKYKDGTLFHIYIPKAIMTDTFVAKYILPALEAGELKLTGEPPATTPWFIDILPSVFMILIFVVFWFVFMQQSQGGGSRVMSFGKSKAKLHKNDAKKKVAFKDVAGLEEEKEELKEIVDFLKNPRKYIELGARIPKGVLMVGPPGTGKTYLSRAVAGEAGVPFFSISGSEFVEMFVGVGASRVRDLFEQAKKNSPCIVFIDEIDAVGRKRGAGLGGGHDEREQTLNQLLVEMDGFGVNEGIIIIAATNRPDILDPALLRPGRFDRQIVVGVPDIKGREEILRVHSKNKPLADDVDLKVLARRTPGFTPADLENLLNEAALLAARKNDKKIHMDTLEEAITRVIAGPEKRSRVISEKDRRLTAYHEAGHAVVARLLPNTDPVHQVTIIPRGRAGGFTMILPKEDKYYMTKTEMEERIVHLLGGRVAEELVLNEISTGAQNDLQRVTEIARSMVTKYGMSKNLGPMTYGTGEEVFLGKDLAAMKDYSEEVAAQIDREIREIIDREYERAERLLKENIDKLHEVAKALLEKETLNADEFEIVFTKGLSALETDEKVNLKKEEVDKKDNTTFDLTDVVEKKDNDVDEK